MFLHNNETKNQITLKLPAQIDSKVKEEEFSNCIVIELPVFKLIFIIGSNSIISVELNDEQFQSNVTFTQFLLLAKSINLQFDRMQISLELQRQKIRDSIDSVIASSVNCKTIINNVHFSMA